MINATAITMVLQLHLTITSDLMPLQDSRSYTGILHVLLLDVLTITLHYWITIRSIISTFTQYWQETGYNVIYFTLFSTKAVWIRLHSNLPKTNKIYVRLTKTDPSTITSLSLMSALPSPPMPPTHNPPSNAPSDPTMSLIAFMHQTLQQSSMIMAHFEK